MTRFLPAQIFLISVLGYSYRAVRLDLRANPSGVQMGIPGLGEDRSGCEKMVRGSKWQSGACLGTRARSHHILCRAIFPFHSVIFFPFSLSGPHFAFSALLLISCYPGLRLTRRFRLRAPRVSIFPSLPFISALNGRNVLIWLFFFLCLFVFFL